MILLTCGKSQGKHPVPYEVCTYPHESSYSGMLWGYRRLPSKNPLHVPSSSRALRIAMVALLLLISVANTGSLWQVYRERTYMTSSYTGRRGPVLPAAHFSTQLSRAAHLAFESCPRPKSEQTCVFYLIASNNMPPNMLTTPNHCHGLKGERKTREIITCAIRNAPPIPVP